MERSKTKRFLSAFLCVVMIAMLLPIPALAASKTAVTGVAMYTSIADLASKNSNFGGVIVRFVAPNTDDNNTSNIRVDFGAYKVGLGPDGNSSPAITLDYKLLFDPTVVKILGNGTPVAAAKLNGNIAPGDMDTILTYNTYPSWVEQGEGVGEIGGTNMVTGGYAIFTTPTSASNFEMAAAKYFDPAQNKEVYMADSFGVYFGLAASAGEMAEYINVVTSDGALDMTTSSEPLYIASAYFSLASGKTINDVTSSTFGLYTTAANATGGYAQGDGSAEKNRSIAMVGFPIPTYSVHILAKDNAGDETTGGTVSVYKYKSAGDHKDGEAIDSVTIGSLAGSTNDNTRHNLLTKGSEVGTYDLKLPDGDYWIEYTKEGYQAGGNQYTVNGAGSYYWGVQHGSSGDNENVNYTIVLHDAESASTRAPFTSGTVDIDVTGVAETQSVNVGSDGSVTFEAPAGTATLSITRTGYEKKTFTNLTLGSTGTITGIPAMPAAGVRTLDADPDVLLDAIRTTVNIPASDGAYVVITSKSAGSVTPNMEANVLPLTETPTDGMVTLTLPDGEYEFTIVTPAAENQSGELDVNAVAGNTLGDDATPAGTVKITPYDASGNPGTPATTPISGADGNGSGGEAIPAEGSSGDPVGGIGTPTAITDPLYYVTGEWDNGGMNVEIHVKNINAKVGTFGMTFDTNIFQGITSNGGNLTPNSNLTSMKNITVNGTKTLTNPTTNNGVILFRWEGKETFAFDGTDQILASFTLGYKNSVTKADAKAAASALTLTELNFLDPTTPWRSQIATANLGDTEDEFVSYYYRPLTTANNNPPAGSPRLDSSKAVNGGFYQTFDISEDVSAGQDTRMQFVYEVAPDATLHEFEIQLPNGSPAIGATVTVGGVPKTLTAADAGKVKFSAKAGTPLAYTVTLEGYNTVTDTVAANDVGVNTTVVTLTAGTMIDVEIVKSQQSDVALVGGKATNGNDYKFSLNPQPGKVWQAGQPAAADLKILIADTNNTAFGFPTGTDVTGTTYDAATNTYTIPAASLTGASGKIIVIGVNDPGTKGPIPDPNKHKVTVSIGAHGNGNYIDDTTVAGGTFTGGAVSPAWKAGADVITETMAAGETKSAKYSFKPEALVDDTSDSNDDYSKRSRGETYKAYVLDKLIVNGAEMSLTNKQRIVELDDYQLTGISSDQAIIATFGIATIDGKGTGTPDDDIIIVEPVPDPTADANITLILSDHGYANPINAVNGATETKLNTANVVGATTVAYSIPAYNGFNATFVPENTGGTEYEVDDVTVDGVSVKGDSTKWASNKLTLASLAGGTNHTIVVTFKVKDGLSMYATLEVIHRAGTGTASPSGITTQTAGLPVTITFTPAANSILDQVDVTYPGGTTTNILSDVTPTATKGVPSAYQTNALTGGTTTVVGFGFDDTGTPSADMMTVQIDVYFDDINYGSITGVTAPNIVFSRTDGVEYAFGPDKGGDYLLAKPTNKNKVYDCKVAKGTYSITIWKNGYLSYTIKDFVVGDDTASSGSAGALGNAFEKDGVVYFGKPSSDVAAKQVHILSGDATWDHNLIALNDIAQVANGMLASSKTNPVQQAHGDIDESGDVDAGDMTYVVRNYGKRASNETYANFMK